jgi:hypothetical protein
LLLLFARELSKLAGKERGGHAVSLRYVGTERLQYATALIRRKAAERASSRHRNPSRGPSRVSKYHLGLWACSDAL